MKKYGTARIAVTYAGCFLGAGYVSGQELWQFFISFGINGYFGLLLAMLMLVVFGVLLLGVIIKSGNTLCDELIIRKDIPALRTVVGIAEVLMMFAIHIVMSAGAGALFRQLTGLPAWCASLVFCAAVCILTFGGVGKMTAVFSVTVPILVVSTLIISLVSSVGGSFPEAVSAIPERSSGGLVFGGWLVSGAIFVSYNLFSSVGVLAPIGEYIGSEKKVISGIFAGTLLLLVVATAIFAAVTLSPQAQTSELPMLTVASGISPVIGYFYGILLLFGMFGTALSSLVGIVEYLSRRIKTPQGKAGAGTKKITSAVLSLVSFAASLFGFADLIGVLFPIGGYFGFAVLILLAEHFVYLKKTDRKKTAGQSRYN